MSIKYCALRAFVKEYSDHYACQKNFDKNIIGLQEVFHFSCNKFTTLKEQEKKDIDELEEAIDYMEDAAATVVRFPTIKYHIENVISELRQKICDLGGDE